MQRIPASIRQRNAVRTRILPLSTASAPRADSLSQSHHNAPNGTKAGFHDIGASDEGLSLARLGRLVQAGWRMSKPFFKEERGACWHLAAVLVLIGTGTALKVQWTMASGALMTAFTERSREGLVRAFVRLVAVCAVIVPLFVAQTYLFKRLQARWRRHMTAQLLGQYFARRRYYHIATSDSSGIDNPDEVLVEQISVFTRNMLHFVADNIRIVCDAFAYSFLLFRLSRALFAATIVLVVFSSLLVNRVGRRLLAVEAHLYQLSASFRFALARARIYAESIAFYSGEEREKRLSNDALNATIDCHIEMLNIERTVNCLTYTFTYLPIMLPTALLAPQYFSGAIKMGHVTQATQAFHILSRNLSFFVNQYEWLSHIGASLERLTRFVDFVSDDKLASAFVTPHDAPTALGDGALVKQSLLNGVASQHIETREVSGARELVLSSLTLHTPGSATRELVRDLSVHVRAGERLLIVGPSGSGKTSLLRAIAGLWTSGSGAIRRPTRDESFFLPQRPYCAVGTLRDQLLYPRGDSNDAALLDTLRRVGLAHLAHDAHALDETRNWSDELSVGETQRLAFARLLISDAALAVIDEGTSALDLEAEDAVMRLACERAGRVLVSVGHRPSLLRFHDIVVRIRSDCSCEIKAAAEFSYPTFH